MIISLQKQLVVLSMPKCATTAIEDALTPYADIMFKDPPNLKHMGYRKFMQNLVPMLRKNGYPRRKMTVVSLMREPEEWLYSWWRYRSRDQLKSLTHPNHGNYAGHVSFEHFMKSYASETPEPYAQVGNQRYFVSDNYGNIGPDLIFRYEGQQWKDFLNSKFGKNLDFQKVNVSPKRERIIDSDLRTVLKDQYEVYDLLRDDGKVPSLGK